jgi:hypothetical protein
MTSLDEALGWALGLGVQEIATPYAPVGPIAWHLTDLKRVLADHGVRLVRLRRPWDSRTWPLATGGFFKLKERLPYLVRDLGHL